MSEAVSESVQRIMKTKAKRRLEAVSKSRLFDLSGNHMEQHGQTVFCETPRLPIQYATPVAVYSRFSLKNGYQTLAKDNLPRAQVFIQSNTGPFSLAMALSPMGARELADALIAAADRADEVQAIVKAAV